MFEIIDFVIDGVRRLSESSPILKAAVNWQPLIPQLLRPQGRMTKEQPERKPTVTDTDVYGRSVRASMGPGAAAASKIFYRSPPEKPYVYKPVPLDAKSIALFQESKRMKSKIRSSGASGHTGPG